MRISSSWANQIGVNGIVDQQAKINQLQMKLAANKKILTAADDPAGAARALDLNQTLKQTDQHQKNILAARQRLSLSDGIVQNVVDVVQKINELGIQGLNDTNSAGDRVAIAVEMESLNAHLLGLANTRNASGEYMFSGSKTDTPAFSKSLTPGGYDYNGDLNQRDIQISTDRRVTDGDPGVNIFGVPSGIEGVPGSSANIFEAIDKFAQDLRNNAPNQASLKDLYTTMDNVQTVQSSIGVRLNALDRQEASNANYAVDMKTVLSQTEDLDYAEALS
ncbi:MAG: flagellar hook-associated protein FlgL, partial [Methylococcales bacterium]